MLGQFLKKINELPAEYVIRIDGLRCLLFSWFLSYGFYGAISPNLDGLRGWLIWFVVTLILMALTYSFGLDRNGFWCKGYVWQFTVKQKDLVILVASFFVLLIVGYDGVSRSLFADEISYAASAHGHGLTLATLISKWRFLEDVKFKYTLQLFSCFAVVFLFFVWRITKNGCCRAVYIFFILFFLLRLAFMLRGGHGNPHPPLELFPLLISGALFGINELGLRLVGLACYTVYLYVIYRMALRKCDACIAFVVAMVIGSIPLALELMTVIEHAFWGYIIFTLVLFELATASSIDYRKLVVLISIGTLLRQSVFVALVPVLIMYILELKRERGVWRLNYRDAQILVPVVLFIPFLLQSILLGTPATSALGKGVLNLGLYEALSSGMVWESFNRVFHLIWLIPILFSFIPLNKGSIKLHGTLILFSVILLVEYYSIDKGIWGLPKYQAEYALPFISLGVFFIALRFEFLKKSWLVLLLSLGVILANISIYKNFTSVGHWSTKMAADFNYKDSYKRISELGLTANSISLGTTYGVFPEVINGYTHTDLMRAKEIYQHHKFELLQCSHSATSCLESLAADRRIKSVLIQGNAQGEYFYRKLLESGWVEDGQFCSTQKACIFLLLKS